MGAGGKERERFKGMEMTRLIGQGETTEQIRYFRYDGP